MAFRSRYILQHSAASGYGQYFASRDRALCALLDGIAAGHYKAGVDRSGVFEYRIPLHLVDTIDDQSDSVRCCAAVFDRQLLKRRWFLRNIGDKIGRHYALKERVARRCHRRRLVLHVYDYCTGKIGPVWVRSSCQAAAGTQWIVLYRRLQWLSNAARAELRRAAKMAIGVANSSGGGTSSGRRISLTFLLFSRRSTLIRQLYGAGVAIDKFVPTHRTVFQFELYNVVQNAFETKGYVAA